MHRAFRSDFHPIMPSIFLRDCDGELEHMLVCSLRLLLAWSFDLPTLGYLASFLKCCTLFVVQVFPCGLVSVGLSIRIAFVHYELTRGSVNSNATARLHL